MKSSCRHYAPSGRRCQEAGVLAGFQLAAVGFRINRELYMESQGKTTWLTLADSFVGLSLLRRLLGGRHYRLDWTHLVSPQPSRMACPPHVRQRLTIGWLRRTLPSETGPATLSGWAFTRLIHSGTTQVPGIEDAGQSLWTGCCTLIVSPLARFRGYERGVAGLFSAMVAKKGDRRGLTRENMRSILSVNKNPEGVP